MVLVELQLVLIFDYLVSLTLKSPLYYSVEVFDSVSQLQVDLLQTVDVVVNHLLL